MNTKAALERPKLETALQRIMQRVFGNGILTKSMNYLPADATNTFVFKDNMKGMPSRFAEFFKFQFNRIFRPSYFPALVLFCTCGVLVMSGCGGGQHGLGPGVLSGPPTTSPAPGSNYVPAGIASAIDSSNNTLYVTDATELENGTFGTMYIVSGASNSMVSSLSAFNKPVAVDVNSHTHTVYVANAGDHTVSVVNEPSNTVVATIPIGNYPSAIAVNAVTNMVYVDNFVDGTVSVIDGATNKVVHTIPSLGTGLDLITVDSQLNQIYVGSNQGYAEAISVINGATNRVTGTLNLKNAPQALAADSNTQTLYAESNETNVTGVVSSSQIDVLNEASGTVTGRIPLSGFVNSTGMAVNPSTSLLYAANNSTGTVDIIKQFSVAGQVSYAAAGSTVYSINVDPVTNVIYCIYSTGGNPNNTVQVNGSANLAVQVIDGQANATLTNISLR